MTATGARPRVLWVTDLAYPARGRRYCDEDIWLTARLREELDLALCHPKDAVRLMDRFDAVVVRNSGPVIGYRAEHEAFLRRAAATGARVFNSVTGKADMRGKQYLVDLFRAAFPVIPTIDDLADLSRLPVAERYVVKPKDGADSIGLAVVAPDALAGAAPPGTLIQPFIDFRYEVSFVFVDRAFVYAVHAPDPARRWELEPYEATAEDVAFARRFVDWNAIEHGVQRVDACRTTSGELLLVELEDLNPWLSLGVLGEAARERFVASMLASLRRLLQRAAVVSIVEAGG